MVIEIDGSQHFEAPHAEKDRKRDEYLCGLGLIVLRFNSRQALKETEAVMEVVYQAVMDRIAE